MAPTDDLPPAKGALPTARQAEVVAYIRAHLAAEGTPPTVREIGAALGIRSTNGVVDHLKALKRKGLLRQDAYKSRSWRPTAPPAGGVPPAPVARRGAATRPALQVPLLGRVAAGTPILAVEQADAVLAVDPQLLPSASSAELYALTVVGDSMVEAGIVAHDILLVERRDTADAGAIVIALIGEEATVKRFVPLPRQRAVRLEPANGAMSATTLPAEQLHQLRIIGVVVGVWRRL